MSDDEATRPDRRSVPRQVAVDCALAVALAVLVAGTSQSINGITGAGVAFGVVGALAIAATGSLPVLPAVVVPACLFGYLATGNPGGPALLTGPVTMVLLGYRAPRRIVAAGVVLVIAAIAGGRLAGFGDLGPIGTAGPAWAVALALLGVTIRNQVDRRAERNRQRDLLRRNAVTDERLSIARDLHDSVAHALASINVQSTVADRLLERDPARAREALAAIRGASGDALDELGWLLNSLRENTIGRGDDDRTPSAGIAGIAELIDRARGDGLTVTVQCEPGLTEIPVPRQIGAAAYRVVQEALSNTTRHAGPNTHVRVRVQYLTGSTPGGIGSLTVHIVDDGHGARVGAGTGEGIGVGLIGMRERAESTGGTLEAGPSAGGAGFSVRARWPIPAPGEAP